MGTLILTLNLSYYLIVWLIQSWDGCIGLVRNLFIGTLHCLRHGGSHLINTSLISNIRLSLTRGP